MSSFRRRLMMAQQGGGGGGQIPSDNGVYILDTNGKYWTKENWNTSNNEKSVGIFLLDGDIQFVIDKKNISASYYGAYGVDIEGLNNVTNLEDAVLDMDGYYNTKKIIESKTDVQAAVRCNSSKIQVNGITINGYLPSSGEWMIAKKYKNEIEEIIDIIQGEPFIRNFYWTSTEYDAYKSWHYHWVYDLLQNTGKGLSTNNCRAFYKINTI